MLFLTNVGCFNRRLTDQQVAHFYIVSSVARLWRKTKLGNTVSTATVATVARGRGLGGGAAIICLPLGMPVKKFVQLVS